MTTQDREAVGWKVVSALALLISGAALALAVAGPNWEQRLAEQDTRIAELEEHLELVRTAYSRVSKQSLESVKQNPYYGE